ncbi:MAG: cytochrome P450 [Chloroflexi bacterium]|nr:cytochrome P450 [Chloroflexota bacterium]
MVAVQFNPLLPEVRANPYPLYHQLREEEPVHWSELMEAWVLTRYDDVSALLKDSRFSADRRKANNRFAREAAARIEEGPLANATTMLGADPPEHTRLRGLVSKAFTPRVVEAMRPHIQEIVDSLLDDVQESGRMDIIGDLAYPLPVIVIAEMLGVPPADRDDFKRWSDDIVATLGPLAAPEVIEKARISIQEMADYFSAVIAERRREPREDLLSALVAAEERGEVLSEEELLATCILLLAAGNETTTNLIGNGMLALLRHPDQLEKLRDQPSLTESAIEEFLRYDGPVQSTARVAKEQLEIRGKTIEEAQLVIALLGAANRDPEQFPNPDELDIARQPNQHIAFGQGIHFCLGSPLARMEGQIAFETLLRRMPNPRLESEEIEWGGTFILRGLKRLPIAF